MLTGKTEVIAQVAGTCIVKMSEDGRTWDSVQCDAKDERDAHYSFRLKGGGRPVGVSHPDAR